MNAAIPLHRRAIAELIGTAFLVAIGPGAAVVDVAYHGTVTHLGVAVAFALIVMAMVATFGAVSGAHINPAVTLALWSDRRIAGKEVPAYLLAQCGGAVLGAAAIAAALGSAAPAGATVPTVPTAAAIGVELVLSILLMLAILAVVNTPALQPVGPFVIGFTVGACALVGGPLTGASMNPARSFGPALVTGTWQAHWIYWAAPIGGMLATVRGYTWIREPGR
ncbi:MAG: aquaporin [Gemmatimonadota bacterium]